MPKTRIYNIKMSPGVFDLHKDQEYKPSFGNLATKFFLNHRSLSIAFLIKSVIFFKKNEVGLVKTDNSGNQGFGNPTVEGKNIPPGLPDPSPVTWAITQEITLEKYQPVVAGGLPVILFSVFQELEERLRVSCERYCLDPNRLPIELYFAKRAANRGTRIFRLSQPLPTTKMSAYFSYFSHRP
ncbi:hypothetical protein CPB83DRAFT_148245 [Crepidotus variabilis]|uniref:Uncharacterized protein n=1 Tax=Crepidotus variabilis TaxID=179855 RepID=A0A9P6EKX3_9AGAR|nr:hypothetical protein CPB83DRAFT_148245 [Crepidotus variabilis]